MKLTSIASNMTELRLDDGTKVLFSYSTPVAILDANGYAQTDVKYSVTTTRHIAKWGAKSGRHVSQSYINALV